MKLRPYQAGKRGNAWKGGKSSDKSGYVLVRMPDHQRSSNGYVREHILIAEKAMGTTLPEKAHVHHYGETWDNSKLVVCEDAEYHMLLHIRQRAYEACGDANKRKCSFCKEYDTVDNLFCRQLEVKKGWATYHVSCRNDYRKARRELGLKA